MIMCLVLLAFHSIPAQPVILAMNRDEFFDRPSAPPQLLSRRPKIFGGKDLRAGGTWLGMNQYGVIVGITNRDTGRAPVKHSVSRGKLCLDALRKTSSREAAHWLADARSQVVSNPFTMFSIDIDEAWCITDEPAAPPLQLRPGWYLLSNGTLNDDHDVRIQRARYLLERSTVRLPSPFPVFLSSILRDHGESDDGNGADAICRHGPSSGTRSSSILVIEFGNRLRYWHAEGPPCEVDFAEMRLPW